MFNEPANALLRIQGSRRAHRLTESEALQYLRSLSLERADVPPKYVAHKDGTETVHTHWAGNGITAVLRVTYAAESE